MALPSLSTVQPSAWAPGKPVEIRVNGDRLAGDLKLWIKFSGAIRVDQGRGQTGGLSRDRTGKHARSCGHDARAQCRGDQRAQLVLVDPLEDVAPASADRTKPQHWPG